MDLQETGQDQELEEGKNSFYRMAPRRYRGKEWLMPDGTLLKPGNTYLELHINNNQLQELIDGDMSIERIVFEGAPGSAEGTAPAGGLIENNPAYQDVKILFGITLLHRGTERLGFTSIEMKPGLFRTP